MIDKLSELLQPINWERCKTNYPVAADKLLRAIDENQKAPAQYTAIRKQSEKTRKALSTVYDFLEGLSEQDRYIVFRQASAAHDTREAFAQGIEFTEQDVSFSEENIDFRKYLFALSKGLAMLEDLQWPHNNSARHPRLPKSHAICGALALVYAVDVGTHPTWGKLDTGELTGGFLKALRKVLKAKDLPTSGLADLAKSHCKKLRAHTIEELQQSNNRRCYEQYYPTFNMFDRYFVDRDE